MKKLISKYAVPLFMLLVLLATGCKTKDLEDQILTLAENQGMLESERDSLIRTLNQKNSTLTMLVTDTARLAAEMAELEKKSNELAVSNATRALKLRQTEYAASTAITRADSLTRANAVLKEEIEALQARLAAIDTELTASQREKEQLTADLQAEEEKRVADSTAMANKPVPVPPKNYGWFVNTTELGGAFGLGETNVDYSRHLFGLTNVFGYAFGKGFTGGVGTGVHLYNGGVMIPLYLDFRYQFNGERFNPFLVADGGYLLNIKEFTSSGLFIYPAVGYNRRLGPGNSMHVAIGPLIQNAPANMRSTFVYVKGGVTFGGK